MGLTDILKRVMGDADRGEEIVGTIVEGPTITKNGDGSPDVLVCRLDTRPDLEFRQVVRALATTRRRGDRVRVHCHIANGVATVDWIEKA